jgi:cytochrome c oxidase subunit 1
MIAKQYLITGIMGIIGVECLCFLECNWHGPEQSFKIFNVLLGDKWAPN